MIFSSSSFWWVLFLFCGVRFGIYNICWQKFPVVLIVFTLLGLKMSILGGRSFCVIC